MDNYVAIVFDSYAQANYAREKLLALNKTSEITIQGAALVRRDAAGKYEVANEWRFPGLRTILGAALGAFVGALIAGPAAIGMGTHAGAVAGMAGDVVKSGEYDESLIEAQARLQENEAAIVAEVSESDPSRLDVSMHALGARIYRRSKAELRGEYFVP